MIRKNFLVKSYLKSNLMVDECHFYFIIFGSAIENMEGNKAGVSVSRQVLSIVLLITVVQPILEIDAQRKIAFPIEGCQEEGTFCEDIKHKTPENRTRLTTAWVTSCPNEPKKVSLSCFNREEKACVTSKCQPRSELNDECGDVDMEDGYLNNNHTLFAFRESCSSTEEKIICCKNGTVESALLAGYGAEAHEFPHQALLFASEMYQNGTLSPKRFSCGGTIYNEKYIITAAHCVIDLFIHPNYTRNEPNEKELEYAEKKEPKQIEVVVGTSLALTARASNRYRVKRIIVHPKYSELKEIEDESIKNNKNPQVYQNDVALLEINGTIKFNEYTKALKIAPENFRPQDHAEKVVIVGWGTTDNLETTEYLQKANLKIRNEDNERPCHAYRGFKTDQHLCLGGIIDDLEYGKTAGGGDSGGPAICRDAEGNGVHCGITSFGAIPEEACTQNPNENTCGPSVYADVSYFRSWIIQEAGVQNRGKTKFHIASLDGINAGNEMAQVKIFTGDGKTCGGTLVSYDTVVTASNCLFDENNESKALIVTFGSGEYYVESVQLITPTGKSNMSVANQKFYDMWINKSRTSERNLMLPLPVEEPYYDTNIGVIKLSSEVFDARPVTLSTLKLVENKDTVYETAWMRNSAFQLRKFPSSVISKENCEGRYNGLTRGNQSFSIGVNDVCMVEKYSGGNICDRELGGGVFCGGPNGRTLCGVQVFRMCDFSTPKIIADMYYYAYNIKNITNNI